MSICEIRTYRDADANASEKKVLESVLYIEMPEWLLSYWYQVMQYYDTIHRSYYEYFLILLYNSATCFCIMNILFFNG